MEGALKKGILLIVVLFLGFYLYTDPNGLVTTAGDLGAKVWALLVPAFEGIIHIINTLTG